MSRLLLLAVFAAAQISASLNERTDCPEPYWVVGNRCLFFDTQSRVTWEEARTTCFGIQGDLAKIDSADLFADVVDFIYEHGFDIYDYWIGGSDAGEEGQWVWLDGSPVRMGTPFWGYAPNDPPHQEPQGTYDQNYICLHKHTFYFFHDCVNSATLLPLCEFKE